MASIFHQRYTVKDESGKTIRKQSQYWYIDYKTVDGTRKRIKGFKDKTATTQLAAKLEKESELAQRPVSLTGSKNIAKDRSLSTWPILRQA